MKIDIFIQTDTHRIGYQKRVNAMYLISCALRNGTVEERNGVVSLTDATSSQAALKALIKALEHFHKAAAIRLYISDNFVRNTMTNGNLSRWRDNGWQKKSGEIKNLELWKETAQLLKDHIIEYAYGPELEHITLKKMEDKLNELRKEQAKADLGEWDV